MTNGEKYKTLRARLYAFERWAYAHCGKSSCEECNVREMCRKHSSVGKLLAWLDLEVEEEKLLPCPFCGKEIVATTIDDYGGVRINCKCGYSTFVFHGGTLNELKIKAISAHNRVAKKCSSELLNKAEHAIEQFERTHDGDVSIVTETDADEDSLVIRIFGGKK